jgi:hypothetical protein
MNRLIVTEYRKLSTLRSSWWVLALVPIIAAAVAAVGVHLAPPTDRLVVTAAAEGIAETAWFLVTVVAILASAGEFQHRTIVTTLLASPRRTEVLTAKAVIIAAYGAIVTALGIGAAVLSSFLTGRIDTVNVRLGTPGGWAGLAGAVLVGALFAILASALGMLTRSTAVALATLLLWRFVAEGILPVVTRHPGVADWTPSGAAKAVVHPMHERLSVAGGGVILLGYVALVTAAAAWTFRHQDPA